LQHFRQCCGIKALPTTAKQLWLGWLMPEGLAMAAHQLRTIFWVSGAGANSLGFGDFLLEL
jgi:hypothetical protein